LDLLLSGLPKYRGEIVHRGNRVAFQVLEKTRAHWYESA